MQTRPPSQLGDGKGDVREEKEGGEFGNGNGGDCVLGFREGSSLLMMRCISNRFISRFRSNFG